MVISCYSKSSDISTVVRKSEQSSRKEETSGSKRNSKEDEFDFLDSGKMAINVWRRYENWACNAPQLKSYGVAAFTTIYDGQMRNQLLLFGGYGHSSRLTLVQNTTWIYSDQLNSWQILDNLGEHPTQRVLPTMVTLCSSNVFLIGGRQRQGNTLKDTWLFLGSTFKWRQVTVVGGLPELAIGAQAVSVLHNSSSCNCSCNEGILFFPCQPSVNWTVLIELSCLEESKLYGWKQKRTHSSIPAVSGVCMPIVTSRSKETVITVVDRCLWYLSVNDLTWTPTTVCVGRDSAFPLEYQLLAVYLEESMTYVLFSVKDRQLLLFSLSTLKASVHLAIDAPLSKGGVEPENRKTGVIAQGLSDREIMVFIPDTNTNDFCGLQKWLLLNYSFVGAWKWAEQSSRDRSPPTFSPYRNNYAVWLNKLYYLDTWDEDKASGVRFSGDYLWSLDLLSMRWELIEKSIGGPQDFIPKVAASCFDNGLWLLGDRDMGLWKYDSNVVYSWTKLPTRVRPTPARVGYSLVAVSSTRAVMFGGQASLTGALLNDVWLFFYEQRTWKQVRFDPEDTGIPPPQYDHAAVSVDSVMFVYGGLNKNNTCLADLWAFYFENSTWVLIKAVNSGPSPGGIIPCKAFTAASAGQLWIAIGCNNRPYCNGPQIVVWTFIIHIRLWQRIGVYNWETGDLAFSVERGALPIVFWQGHLLMVGGKELVLFSMKLGCPVGFASENLSKFPCMVCEIGSYAAEGSELCSSCPEGTTTANRGSETISDCSVCRADYCHHGKCFAIISDSNPVPFCDCHTGYTGTFCQYATYYYVGLGIVLFVLVTVTGVTIIVYIWRKRKMREREFRRQIDQMNGVWQINGNGIEMLEEIGKGAAGCVWLAKYRDIIVAMKMLLVPDDPQMCLEFAREITFMQTIRHPNIVLFLGAGRFHPDGQPFLIAEFMRRGSLRQVLDDAGIQLTARRKIQFATDVAKGMKFLHNLDPPRLHRDLKSENLLVSESWVVKVADFGLGRPANPTKRKSRSGGKQGRFLTHRVSMTLPLLDMEGDMSLDGIGTARWSAPELSRRQRYDGSVDVYRLGSRRMLYMHACDIITLA